MPLDTIKDVRDVITAAEEIATLFETPAWWRGQSVGAWPLLPKVNRPVARPGREQNLTLHFQAQAETRRADCPDRRDYPAWLFLMQHYGLATRLLDWTWSVLIALFFAVRNPGHDAETGVLWALEPAGLNEGQGYPPKLPVPETIPDFFRGAFEDVTPTGHILAVAAHEVDIRMMVQLSAFTIHDTDKGLETIVADPSPFLRKYTIPSAAKARLRDRLQLLAIEASYLFPDLEHLAADLNARP